MRSFLGGELYKLMYDNWDGSEFAEERFQKLWLGDDTGDILFFGLWRAIGAYAIANIIKNNAFNVTRYSNSDLDTDIESHAEQTAYFTKASQAKSQGIKMQAEANEYLLASDEYPEWSTPAGKEQPTTFEYIRVRNNNTFHI